MDRLSRVSNINEATFNSIADSVVNQFRPYADLHHANLTVEKLWTDPTVNAYADQDSSGNTWTVHMFGGLARRSEITPDGFALVVCHELGHHFGGFAYYSDTDWAASEGQADYFATEACARLIWGDSASENAKHRNTVPKVAKTRCDQVWNSQSDRDLCYRVADAGASLAKLLAVPDGNSVPKFDTPDSHVVKETYVDHPEAQCRLDTYLSGGLCKAQFDLRIIPGRSNVEGETSLSAEKESALYSCTTSGGYTEGLRPACWYKARM